ncbi:MAG: hypothetical protein FWD15_00970 [Alphaproteobacteria bacterium]|nr:hypothetical protein [Alphaproteobacteria bacterium]
MQKGNFVNNARNIVFISDEGYALPTRVAIRSLVRNTPSSENLNVYVICTDMAKSTADKFAPLSSKNVNVEIKEIENKLKSYSIKHGHVSAAACLKYDLANIFPKLDRILYLDGDLVITGSLDKVFKTDIKNAYAAMVEDRICMLKNNHHLRIGTEKIFNSGVMYLNLAKIRADKMVDKMLAAARHPKRSSSYQDQDIINKVFDGHIVALPPEYNYYIRYYMPEYLNHVGYKDLQKLEPKIVHYSAKTKPWKSSDLPKVKEWLSYLSPDDREVVLAAHARESNRIPLAPKKQSLIKTIEKLDLVKKVKKLFIPNKIAKLFYQVSKRDNVRRFKFFGIRVLKVKIKPGIERGNFLPQDLKYIASKPGSNNLYLKRPDIDAKIAKFTTSGTSAKPRSPKLIVSLTSYPARMNAGITKYAIFSLLNQSVKPDKVILYLCADEFPGGEASVPADIKAFKKNGLEIRFYDCNIRSYTKLVPALGDFPDYVIATADDDIFYPSNWLEKLYDAYLKNPKAIHCHRARRISFSRRRGIPRQYSVWKLISKRTGPSVLNFLTGVGGVIYPPHSLHSEVLNKDMFIRLAPTTDDIWFWAMATKQGTKICVVPRPLSFQVFVDLENETSPDESARLGAINCMGSGNDVAVSNILGHYRDVYEKLKSAA